MIPRTYPSTLNPITGQRQLVALFLNNVTELKRWSDYIPVNFGKGTTLIEGSYDNNGYIAVQEITSGIGLTPFNEYVPVFFDPTATDTWQVSDVGFIPYGASGVTSAPSLDLVFTRSDSLDPRVTFTRASSATYTNSAGLLTNAATNLLPYSATLSTGWIRASGATWTSNAEAAPDGAMDALGVVGLFGTTVNNALGALYRTATPATVNTTYTLSFYVKTQSGVFTDLRLRIIETGGNSTTSNPITVTNEWSRVSLTVTTAAGATAITALLGTGSTSSFANVYIWGAQLETGAAATTYIRTEAVSTSAPRFDYDPVTLAPKGLLIEESRTNLALYSSDYLPADWLKASVVITPNIVTAPDGTLTASKYAPGVVGYSSASLSQVVAKPATAVPYSATFYLKQGEFTLSRIRLRDNVTTSNYVEATFDLAAGTVSIAAAVFGIFTAPSATITSARNGWYRCSVTATTSTETSLRLMLFAGGSGTGNSVSGFYLWGAQLEAGAFATSYIPTVASQVTRAADVAVMTGTNFSSWYNQTEGTFFTSQSRPVTAIPDGNVINTDDGTSANRFSLGTGASGTVLNPFFIVGNVSQAALNQSGTTGLASNQIAVAYKLNDFAGATNGATAVTDTSGTVPPVDRMRIGVSVFGAGSYWNSHIRRISYFPRRLANAELQGLTA